jgi:penicillin-binding protein 1A
VREVISLEIAREMMVLLQAVVQHGTGAAAASLHHPFGGKTGTTNGYTDAWFIGFSPSITCGTWIGFDNRQTLGEKETGAKAALPMWMDFMKVAIADKPNEEFAKANAPKKKIDVPITPAGEAMPAEKQDPEDDSGDEPDTPPGKAKPQPLQAPAGEPLSVPFPVELQNDKPHGDGSGGPLANATEPPSYQRSNTAKSKIRPIILP